MSLGMPDESGPADARRLAAPSEASGVPGGTEGALRAGRVRPETQAEAAPPRVHLAHVEGLRAVAALMVFLNHAYAQTWSAIAGDYPSGFFSIFSYTLVTGHLSVSVFIVISGFCLALPVAAAGDRLRQGVRGFLERRAKRILPPYYGALGVSLLLIATVIGEATGTLWDVPIQVTWVAIVSHLLLLQDLYATGSINYVFWSIAVEWQLYFLFPLLVLAYRKFGVLKTTVAALALGYALRFGFADFRLARANPHFLGLFTMGMLGAYLVRSPRPELAAVRRKVPWAWVGAGGLAVAVAAMGYWGFLEAARRFHYLDLPVGIMALAVLVHSTRTEAGLLNRTLSWRPLVFIGTFSYSLYLLHAPLLQILWQYVFHPAGLSQPLMFLSFVTVGLLVVLGASYAFFRVFEAPFLRKARRAVATGERPLEPSLAGPNHVPAPERRIG